MLSAEDTDPIMLFIREGIGENNRLSSFNGPFGDPSFGETGGFFPKAFRAERTAHFKGLFHQGIKLFPNQSPITKRQDSGLVGR